MSASSNHFVGPTCKYGCCGPKPGCAKSKRIRARADRRKSKKVARDG